MNDDIQTFYFRPRSKSIVEEERTIEGPEKQNCKVQKKWPEMRYTVSLRVHKTLRFTFSTYTQISRVQLITQSNKALCTQVSAHMSIQVIEMKRERISTSPRNFSSSPDNLELQLYSYRAADVSFLRSGSWPSEYIGTWPSLLWLFGGRALEPPEF